MRTFLITCIFIIPGFTMAQGSLKGSIKDDQSELIGATVYIPDLAMGTTTDSSGKFYLLNIPAGDYLISFSFIGYEKQIHSVTISSGGTTDLAITLQKGSIQLPDLIITSTTYQAVNFLSQVDINLHPINSSQDILRLVPGLFIAQHAGGGKAEQIFLRGFDVDHGTDINIEVDGIPVNMVSHAHGQGYADLHFLIPELIQLVDFNKGPYYADKGDFNTAGYVSFQTKNKLERNFAKIEGGSFGNGRLVTGVNIPFHSSKTKAYIASELTHMNGYFESSQKFYRLNIQSRLTTEISDRTKLQFGFSHFKSDWNASGQIPTRAVENGVISRFGSIDNTEGGNTDRTNFFIKSNHRFNQSSSLENQVFIVNYHFNLFSNFTFYLNDPLNGDQIDQKEGRWIYGYRSHYFTNSTLWGKVLKTELGGGIRSDYVNNISLARTIKRDFMSYTKLGDLNEQNLNAFWNETYSATKRLTLNASLRLDFFRFSYLDKLSGIQSASTSKSIASPKFTINYQASAQISFFFKYGLGFHSNDARVVVDNSVKETLPRAYGLDLGTEIKLTSKLYINAALWRLDLDQEFVYVGDEGIIEPSGKTKRVGVDLSVRYQINSWLFTNIDLNGTNPRTKDGIAGQNYIPLAPTFTTVGGINFHRSNGLEGNFGYRYIADRAANEDKSSIAKGYLIFNAMLSYAKAKNEFGISTENIFNTKWKEAQFDTETRLLNESQPVTEIHFTPGTPLAVKIRYTRYF
ncbi:MAG: TonB-dependent receptor [Cyclobacteriaceae bacterium]|nr:TonB-dependent receptor [Cyclobacteriaceae bacterium]